MIEKAFKETCMKWNKVNPKMQSDAIFKTYAKRIEELLK